MELENMNIQNEKIQNLFSKVDEFSDTKGKTTLDVFKGVYIFASFDLVNSTKIKYRDSSWLKLIRTLIEEAFNQWFGLNFWKFNGDELLFYSELTGINQLAKILHRIYSRSNDLYDKLSDALKDPDETIKTTSDLVGIKTAVWLAHISNESDAINYKLTQIDYPEFAGINMDEGFRMSKLATQNKIIVDPKIAFLICLTANEIFQRMDSNYKNQSINTYEPQSLEGIFVQFFDQSTPTSEEEDLFKIVSNNFRIIGYEKCKGVWDERPYPIIWYSDNWDSSIENIRYDEMYNDVLVTKELINCHYKDYQHAYLETLKILKKIYNNVGIFSLVINKMLNDSNLKLSSTEVLEKPYYLRTFLYHTVVCINKETNAVLVFLRSDKRGHMPSVWDFEQQKNAQTLYGLPIILQIQDKFKKRFGIDIKVVQDVYKQSIIPMGIHPIFRKGAIHNGILCFAYIDMGLSENEILDIVRKNLPEIVSSNGYPLYCDVAFVHSEDLHLGSNPSDAYIKINETEISELTYPQISKDSISWNVHNKGDENTNQCIPNFVKTISDAIKYSEKDT